MKYFTYSILLLLFISCKKDPEIIYKYKDVYIGNTYRINKSADYDYNYYEEDTLYSDTIVVRINYDNTISFINNNVNYSFDINEENYYNLELFNNYKRFELFDDSLKTSFWYYSGVDIAFNETRIKFKGEKIN